MTSIASTEDILYIRRYINVTHCTRHSDPELDELSGIHSYIFLNTYILYTLTQNKILITQNCLG